MKDLQNFNTWTDVKVHQRIGEILLSAGKINLIQLGMALDIQRFKAMPLGEVFVVMNVIDDNTLKDALAVQKSIDDSIGYRGADGL